MHTPHAPNNRHRIPVPHYSAVLHDFFDTEHMQAVQAELTDWWAASKVLPKGYQATPIDEAVERLVKVGLVNTARVFSALGDIGLASPGNYPNVAWYDLDNLRNGHPSRHNPAQPAIRHTVILEGQTVIRTGGIDVLGSHLFATGVTASAGDDFVANYTDSARYPLVSFMGATPVSSRLTIDFIA